MTDSLNQAIDAIDRRRATPEAYNRERGIEPQGIIQDIASPLLALSNLDDRVAAFLPPRVGVWLSPSRNRSRRQSVS